MIDSLSTTTSDTGNVGHARLGDARGEGDRARPLRLESALALAAYSAISFLYFGFRVVGDFTGSYVGGNGPDPKLFVWAMAWWPHSIGMVNPLFSPAIWAPEGYNLTWATTVPLLSMGASPVTLAFGPVASYNVLMLAAPALAGWTAYLLCRHVARSHAAALLGGYLFGFSSYQLSHMRGGHLNLLFVFLIPVAVLLVLEVIEGGIRRRRFLVLMTVTLACQFLISLEVFATASVLGIGCLLLAWLLTPPGRREPIRRGLVALLLSYVFAGLLVAPILAVMFGRTEPFQGLDVVYGSADILNFVLPTELTWLGGSASATITHRFTGSVSGQSAYFGFILLIILVWFVIERRGSVSGRVLGISFAAISMLSLGPVLKIAGQESISLPWELADGIPLIEKALPGRFILYAFLAVAVALALWLTGTQERPMSQRLLRWGLALLAIVLMVPTGHDWMWRTTLRRPDFFSTGAYIRYIRPGDNILIIGPGTAAEPMVWQADSDFRFELAAAYTGGVPPDLASDPLRPYLQQQHCVPVAVFSELREFLLDHDVDLVVAYKREKLCPTLDLEVRPVDVLDVRIYRLKPQ